MQYSADVPTRLRPDPYEQIRADDFTAFTLAGHSVRELGVELATHDGRLWTAAFSHELVIGTGADLAPGIPSLWRSVICRDDDVVANMSLAELMARHIQMNLSDGWLGTRDARVVNLHGGLPESVPAEVLLQDNPVQAIRVTFAGLDCYGLATDGVSVSIVIPCELSSLVHPRLVRVRREG